MTLIRTKLSVEQWRAKARIDALANKMAFDAAVSIIQCHGTPIQDKRGHLLWYSVDPRDPLEGPAIREALLYLDLSGRLRRRRHFPYHVNVRWGK